MQSDPQDEQMPRPGPPEPWVPDPPRAEPGAPGPDTPQQPMIPPEEPVAPLPSGPPPDMTPVPPPQADPGPPAARDPLDRDPGQGAAGEPVAPANADASFEPEPVEPLTEADWLDRICPYLLSEDGTYRSTQPDPGHRCTAQDPPGTLPLAFQERFCLTDRHVRCEMYKVAQSARSAAFEEEGIPAEQVQGARFKPSVRSVPLALGPSSQAAASGASQPSRLRQVVIAAGVIGAAILLIIVIVMLSGPGGGDSEPGASASATAIAPPTPTPTPRPTSTSTATPATSPDASASPGTASGALVALYEVQDGEKLQKIADKFGTTRRAILRVNEGMIDKSPFVEAGDRIRVPVSFDMPVADIEAITGFIRFVEGQ